jgi:N-acetylmuramoyl-L-alanine amidase
VAGTLRIVFDLGVSVATTSRLERDGAGTRLIVELTPKASAGRPPAAATVSNPVFEAPPPELVQREAVPAVMAEPLAAPRDLAPPLPASAELGNAEAELLFAQAAASRPEPPAPVRPAPSRPAPQVRIAAPALAGNAALPSPRKPVRTLQDVIGPGQRKLVVAIDAGHGGKDPGAHGPSGVREKVVTLEVARELARQVNADPGMRAVLIRNNDSFVPLKDRYMIARRAQADLFISIHADASPNNSASGASVFVLSTRGASSQAARWLADQENAADLVGGVSLDRKDFNLASVLLDLSQSATMRASDDIANQVLDSLKNVGKAHKPAIERANFVVLRSPDVPSMLIETGFITNPSEEQRLNDPGYRSRLASAITTGVRRYFLDQAPPGSWYASRQGAPAPVGAGLGLPQVASSPE